MPIYQREGSPYWWMSITVPGRPRFRGSTGETDQRKARLAEAEKFQQIEAGVTPADGWRLRDCLGAFWNEHAQHLDSAGDIFFHFELLSEFLGRDTRLAEITNSRLLDYRAARRGGSIKASPAMVEPRPSAWRRRMVTEQGYVRPVQPQTVNRDFAHLQAAMNWAKEMHGQKVPDLVWKRLKVSEPEHRIRFAGADEFAALIEAAHEDLRPLITAAVTTGLRRANLLELDWHQVDLGSGTITVPRTKGRKPIVITIVPALRAVLARTEPKLRKGPVFDTTNYKRRWAAAMKAAGMVDFRWHDLRHTFGSWARMNGADLADICDAMAHSNIAVTMRYAHIKPGEHTTAFDRVGDLLTPKPKRTRKSA